MGEQIMPKSQDINIEGYLVQQDYVKKQFESASQTFKKYRKTEKVLKQQIDELEEKQKLCLSVLDRKAQNLMAEKEFLNQQNANFPSTDFLIKQYAILKDLDDTLVKKKAEESLNLAITKLQQYDILHGNEEIEKLDLRIDEISQEVFKKRAVKDFSHLYDVNDTEEILMRKVLLLKAAAKKTKCEMDYSIKQEKEAINFLKRELLVYKRNSLIGDI